MGCDSRVVEQTGAALVGFLLGEVALCRRCATATAANASLSILYNTLEDEIRGRALPGAGVQLAHDMAENLGPVLEAMKSATTAGELMLVIRAHAELNKQRAARQPAGQEH